MLHRLLLSLQNQETNNIFSFSIVVVDNDFNQSAKNVVLGFKTKTPIDVKYVNEPVQNIALARNMAVEAAQGNPLAFIDDDEFPTPTWLLRLYEAYRNFNADGVLGPVKPHFDEMPPSWILRGKFCERQSHQTGTVLHWSQARTGNVLFDASIFSVESNRFNSNFGRTGGEDIEFFKRMSAQGRVFVWCNEAEVFETVPPERWRKSFFIRNSLRMGGLAGKRLRKEPFWLYRFLPKRIIMFLLYTCVLPFSFLFGEHVYMKCLTKFVYSVAWILGSCGLVIISSRND